MKKRLLSALLALALVFVLLPTTALAEEVTTNGDISIAGKGWNFKKSTSGGYETVYYQVQSKNGVFSTSLDNKTGCVWPSNPYLEITRTGNTITVIVHNEVTITTNKGTNNAAEECIEVNKSNNQTTTLNLVIKGAEGTTNNTLTLECKGYGSALSSYQGGITITGGVTVNAKSTYTNSSTGVSARAINVFNGDLTISGTGTTVNAENKDRNHPTIDVKNAVTISDGATLTAKNTNGGKAISFGSITADGYDFMGRSGNSGSYTTLTGDDKATRLQEYSSIQITPTPTLEKSNVYVAGTNLYKNTAYTIQNGKPVMGGTYPGNYNIYFDATDYVLHVKDAVIEATGNVRGTRGIDGTSDIVFEGDNSITASSYGIYLDFKSSDLKISGTGSLEVKTIAGDPAIATANNYNTSKSIIISGQGFTVTADTSETTSYAIRSAKDLTITDGAAVIAKSNEKRAIDIDGDLTVTNGSLTATSKSNNVPTVQVGGNASFTGSTVTITNNSTTQGKSGEYSYEVSTGLYVGGTLDIKNAAKVTSTVIGGNAIRAVGNITVSDGATVTATNNSQHFSAITAGQASGGVVNTAARLIVSGDGTQIHAINTNTDTNLVYRAIHADVYNNNTDFYLNMQSEGVIEELKNKNIAPNKYDVTGGYKVTITRGDAYVAPTKTITEIIVTGLTPPVKGATPVDKSKVTLTDGLTVESITWGPALTSDGKFAANTAYTAHIKYSVNAGYELAAKANCPQVDGANVTRWHQEGMPQDEIEVTFPKTAADTPTEKPTITLDLPAPVAGVAPVTTGVTATSSDNTPLTIDKVEWYAYTVEYNNGKFERIVKGNKVSGNFEANTYYLAEITFDKSISFANGGLNITAPTWPLEGSWPESCIYRVIENSYTARILFPATDAACNHQPGDWQDGTDGEHHVKVCAICHNVVATESHAFGGYQINTNNSHTRVCSVCNAAYTNAHEFNSYAHNENSHWKVCVCGATTSYANHEFDPATGACACGATQSGGNPTPDVPAAPTGLAGVAPTSANSKDGKITGTTAAMEYATEPNGSNWIECGGDEVTGLSAGTYYVRYKRTTDKPASAVATVVVPAYSGGGEIVPPTPDNPGTIVIIRPAEEEKPAQQPNPSTGANDLVGLAVAAAVAAALGSAALLRKHD